MKKPKLLYSETTPGGQSVTFKAAYQLGSAKLRIDIKCDSYDFQSHARIERFDGAKWCFLESIHYSQMSTQRELDREKHTWYITNHQQDAERLLKLAGLILSEEVTVSTDADENWQNNAIQFPRLLAEIMATGALNEGSWGELLDSMDLESDQLAELFERAQKVWEEIKQRTVAVRVVRDNPA